MNPLQSKEMRVLDAFEAGCKTTRDVATRTLLSTEEILRLAYRLEKRGLLERAGSILLNDAAKNNSHAWRLAKPKRGMRCANCGGTVLERNHCNRYPGCPTYPYREAESSRSNPATPLGRNTKSSKSSSKKGKD